MTTGTPDRILRLAEALSRTGLTRSTLYRKIVAGQLPPPGCDQHAMRRMEGTAVNTWIRNPMFYSIEDFPDT